MEKVLAGAFRREMALEYLCAKHNAEIVQLNRLVCLFKVAYVQARYVFHFDDIYDGSSHNIFAGPTVQA